MDEWWIYILSCDGKLYTGISRDPRRRLKEHRSGGRRGARFTRSAASVELKYAVCIGDKSAALRAEYRIKKLTRSKKMIILQDLPDRESLFRYLGCDE
jgi:putative endonuclease